MVDSKRPTLTEAIATVNAILVDEFECEAAALADPTAKLNEDLGLDSLDGVDLVVAIEKSFRYRIPEQEARSIRTLQDIYDQVGRHLGSTTPETV